MLQAILSSNISSGVAAMDALHHEIFEALDELSSVKDSEFIGHYDAFVKRMERAFATEDKWMEEIDFPILKSHREQHARVLGGLHGTRTHVVNGDLKLGRKVVEKLLPQWFIFHSWTMDAVLATAMQMIAEQNEDQIPARPNFFDAQQRALAHA